MNAQEIIQSIKANGAVSAHDITNVLEDGQALEAMGITDEHQELVEEAHALVSERGAVFLEKEQDWANESTRYWFKVDGDEYAVVESGGQSTIINKDGDDVYDRALESSLKSSLIVTDAMRAE